MIALLLASVLTLVDPFVGTSGTKIGGPIDTFPGADAPLGMIQWSPDTPSQPAGGGYDYTDRAITGFSLTHLSGPGCSVFGDAAILPTVGTPAPPADVKQPFSHATESASPGYYAVTIGEPAIRVELTAAARSGIARLTFPGNAQANVLVNPASNQAGVSDASVRVASPTEIDGSAASGSFCGMPDTYTVYFVLQFDRPMNRSGVWSAAGPNAAAYAQFDTTHDPVVNVRAAVSWVSIDGARANLHSAANETFDQMHAASQAAWQSYLQRASVTGGTAAEQRTFYTALYHVLLHPNLYSDIDGRYRGFDGAVHRVRRGHAEYATFSGWDIYRTQIPLLALLAPQETSDMMQSLVDAAHQGGWLPKWSLVNGYTGVMGGDSADPVIAGAYAFGARDFDLRGALAAMVKNATDAHSPPGQGWYRPRPGLNEYERLGYVANTHTTNVSPVRNGASLTLEYAQDDFSVAQFARAIGERRVYRAFMGRSQRWRNLFDTSVGAIAPRGSAGAFENTPVTENGQSGFQEGNAAQYTWMVPYDAQSLIYGMGGRSATIAALDRFFTKINAGQDHPYAWLGNEPSLGVPWIYLNAGTPWKAQRVIRDALEQLYADSPEGIPGNDDLGTMSAWYVWCAIGLYPVNPSVRAFDIGAPMFARVQIAQPHGVDIDVRAPQASADAAYVQSVRVNGAASTRTWTPLPGSGTLTLEVALASSPSQWGTARGDAPLSYRASLPQFPHSTTARFEDPASAIRLAPAAGVTVALAVKGGDGEAIAWHAGAPNGLTVTPSRGTFSEASHISLTITASSTLSPHAYPITISGETRGGALLEPLHLAAIVAPAGARVPLAYVPNYSDNDVTAFDPQTGAVAATIAVGKNPGDAALGAGGSRLYVPNQGSNDVSVIDTATNTVIATVKTGKIPATLRIAPDGKTAWVSNYGDNTIQAIDLATLRAEKPIAVGRAPQQLAISGDSATVYVVNQNDNTVTPVDVRSAAALAPIGVGAKPGSIILSRDGRTAYVGNQAGNSVTPIHLGSRTAGREIPAGVQPQGMALSPDGALLYVADSGSDTVSVLDVRSGVRVHTIRAGLNPASVALSPEGKTLYAVLLGDNACVKIPIENPRERSIVELGNAPLAIALP
ncbi:MAG TPA: GH92 family glycosyl hydrolase [Candidatus Baltobacteraceae bacterium]|nr:GH92 family glycosyl hydrolase [Candidatus Baltobacteraceae bacterium]